jgi:transposase
MAKSEDRDGRLEARWRRIIGEHAHSGLTIRAFCRRGKLHESAFYFWRRELERRDVEQRQTEQEQLKRPSAQAAFVPVRVARDVPLEASGRIVIMLSGGRRVHVVGPVDRQALADVLAVLAAASPERLEGRPC